MTVTDHVAIKVIGPRPVRGLLTGSPVGPGNWRMSPGQSDAVVSDNHTMGACLIGGFGDPAINWEEEGEGLSKGYGGHFVCESVRPEYRPLILAAPHLLIGARAALDALSEGVASDCAHCGGEGTWTDDTPPRMVPVRHRRECPIALLTFALAIADANPKDIPS